MNDYQNQGIPSLVELFSGTHLVIWEVLIGLRSPFDHWYPVKKDSGEVDTVQAKQMFLDLQGSLGADDLTGGMPFMRYQPMSGSDPRMLVRIYDPDEHRRMDMKDEDAFRARRASLGCTHGAARGIGCNALYGGFKSRFDAQAMIRGPLFAGDGCDIRTSAKAIGPSVLGNDTLLNTSSVFVRSIMGDGTQIDDHVTVKDSLIGRKVRILTGARLLHWNDPNALKIEVRDRRYDFDQKKSIVVPRIKMGCVIGDRCVIGAGSIIGPGSILLPGCRVPDGLILPSGIYDQRAICKIANNSSSFFASRHI